MTAFAWIKICFKDLALNQIGIYHTFSLSVASNLRSSLFFSFPGASAIGNEEWNTKSFPATSAACEETTVTKRSYSEGME